jgi:hypothetical protein
MNVATGKQKAQKPKKISITVSLEPANLAILEEWENRYSRFSRRDDFINGAIRFMKSQDHKGLDPNCQPINPMDRRKQLEEYISQVVDERKEDIRKELMQELKGHPKKTHPQKPGRVLQLIPPSPTQEKGA